MRKRKRRDEHDNTDRWLVSYADFITLLFAFFTTMYAISQVDARKLDIFTGSMRSALKSPGPETSRQVIAGVPPIAGDMMKTEDEIRKSVGAIDAGGDINVRRDNRGVVISFGDRILFNTGQADIKTTAVPALSAVASVLRKLPNTVIVEGHTDNVPITGNHLRYVSNWELSVARSTSILNYFLGNQTLSPEKFVAAGYAEFRPIATNETPEGREKNRRVDIVVLRGTTH